MKAVWPRSSLDILFKITSRELRLASSKPRRWVGRTPSWICTQCRAHSQLVKAEPTRPGLWKKSKASYKVSLPSITARRHESTSNGPQSSQHEAPQSTSRKDLPSQAEHRRSLLSKRFTHVMDNVQSNIFLAGQRLNDLTGYSGIETLKKEIEEQELLVQQTRSSLRSAKESYSTAIASRSSSQREVNELLQRKHVWTPSDLERFTSLYRSDHANEQAETSAEAALASAERAAEEAASKLNRSILARYHEEQIWSDKIRRMSTWGTWGLMGVNVLLFLVFQIGVEPWRRGRLVRGFEEKVVEAIEREKGLFAREVGATREVEKGVAGLREERGGSGYEDAVVELAMVGGDVVGDANAGILGSPGTSGLVSEAPRGKEMQATETQVLESSIGEERSWLKWWRILELRIRELFSERTVTVRQVDLTAKAIEGTFAGFAIAGIMGIILRSLRGV